MYFHFLFLLDVKIKRREKLVHVRSERMEKRRSKKMSRDRPRGRDKFSKNHRVGCSLQHSIREDEALPYQPWQNNKTVPKTQIESLLSFRHMPPNNNNHLTQTDKINHPTLTENLLLSQLMLTDNRNLPENQLLFQLMLQTDSHLPFPSSISLKELRLMLRVTSGRLIDVPQVIWVHNQMVGHQSPVM